MKQILVFSLIFTVLVFSGCGGLKPSTNAEDKVVQLKELGESPKGEDRDYQVGEDVSVIYHDGKFLVEGVVEEIGGEIVFVEDSPSKQPKEWKPAESVSKISDSAKRARKSFRVRIGTGRHAINEWFPAEQLFPAPWANNKNLKVGDTVYQKRFGDFKPKKGIITDLPQTKFGGFKVKFENKNIAESVERKEIFSSIEQAKPEDISPGKIVYYEKKIWAIVIGKLDNRINIRESGSMLKDISVDISKLEVLQ